MKVNVTLPEENKKGAGILDLSKGSSPFQKASSVEKRLKLLLWGDSGTGKTTMSLQFPKPVILDLENGSEFYGNSFDFDVLKTNHPDEIMQAVDWLARHKHPYKTLIVDPITVYWEALQRKWSDIFLKRNRGSKGFRQDFYDFQVKDWQIVKAELKELIRKLLSIDLNVILIARQKTKFKEGSFMVAVGETFDGEKSLPYMFDTIVRLFVDEKGNHMGYCIKDRSNKLPKEAFACSYKVFENLFGKESLNREAKPIEYATAEQKEKINRYVEQFNISQDQLSGRLSAYEAETLDDLTKENADVIIKKFESAIAAQSNEQKSKKEKEPKDAKN